MKDAGGLQQHMSYMRGDNYIWSDGERLHIWVADGYDGWDAAIWAIDEREKRHEDRVNASGVGIPEEVMDEFVMMRLAQIVEEGLVDGVIARAVARSSGNFGCAALMKKSEQLKAVLRQI
jgi:hypothetical protein